MNFRDHLPVSTPWLNKLEAEGAVDCFQGKLKTYRIETSHPLWARSLQNALTPAARSQVEVIIPTVKKSRLGGKHQSPKLERYRYYTAAWSSHPCHCKYRYDGFWNGDVGCIGNPNPPLRTNASEALNWSRLGITVKVLGFGGHFAFYCQAYRLMPPTLFLSFS